MTYTSINVPAQNAPYQTKAVAFTPTKVNDPDVAHPYFVEQPKPFIASKGRLGAAATIAAGGALTLVGIPLLILPGPGLLTVGGGIALITKGVKNLRSRSN